jgi:hypothetical protein
MSGAWYAISFAGFAFGAVALAGVLAIDRRLGVLEGVLEFLSRPVKRRRRK